MLDFGLARRVREEVQGETVLTTRNNHGRSDARNVGLTGTVSYMAPEILRGQEVDHRSDLWASAWCCMKSRPGSCRFRTNLDRDQRGDHAPGARRLPP